MKKLDIFLPDPPTIWCNNLATTNLSVNPILHARTKYMELGFHFVRDRAVAKTFRVSFIPNKDQVVDILTKSLSSIWFDLLHFCLTISYVPLGARGAIRAKVCNKLQKDPSSTMCELARNSSRTILNK